MQIKASERILSAYSARLGATKPAVYSRTNIATSIELQSTQRTAPSGHFFQVSNFKVGSGSAKKWPGVILNLTDLVPPELIIENFITKYSVLNFPSLARRSGNVAELSAINDVIKRWTAIKDSQGPAANNTLSFREGVMGTGGRCAPSERAREGPRPKWEASVLQRASSWVNTLLPSGNAFSTKPCVRPGGTFLPQHEREGQREEREPGSQCCPWSVGVSSRHCGWKRKQSRATIRWDTDMEARSAQQRELLRPEDRTENMHTHIPAHQTHCIHAHTINATWHTTHTRA